MKKENSGGRKLVIVRVSAREMDFEKYNSQEVGLALELARHGFSTKILERANVRFPREKNIGTPGKGDVELALLRSIRLPGRQFLMPGIFGIIGNFRPSIIQIHDDLQVMNLLCAIYGRLKGIPVVLVNGIYGSHSSLVKRLVSSFLGFFLKRLVSGCVAKTPEAKMYLEGRRYPNIVLGPVGLNTQNFNAPEKIRRWRRELKIPKAGNILLYVGQLEKRRNVVFLIELLKKLNERTAEFHLVLAGDGPDKERVLRAVESNGVGSYVHYVGKIRQGELPQLYREAGLLLLPSEYEIFGMVMLEAGYFGLPVLTTPTAGGRLIIREGVNGFILRKIDVLEWASAIERFFRGGRRRKLSQNARRNVRERYLWSETVKPYLGAYGKALRRPGRKLTEINILGK